MANAPNYLRSTAIEQLLNRLFGVAIRLGLGLSHNYLLEVRGRKSGRLYRTPVNLLELGARRYLVSSRGETQWVRNARAAGRITLRKGTRALHFRVREVGDGEKPELLKEFLDRFRLSVQRFYPVAAGSPAADFAPLAARYPVFELEALTRES